MSRGYESSDLRVGTFRNVDIRRRRKGLIHVIAGALTAGLVFATSACGKDPTDGVNGSGNDVSGTLKEWAVTVNKTSATAGEVSFSVTNAGTIEHEFVVVKTDYENGKIPKSGNTINEKAPGVEVIDEIAQFPVNDTRELTVSLESGSYQLLCNLPGHYAAGMHTVFSVSS